VASDPSLCARQPGMTCRPRARLNPSHVTRTTNLQQLNTSPIHSFVALNLLSAASANQVS
jgi:hypothetical protein